MIIYSVVDILMTAILPENCPFYHLGLAPFPFKGSERKTLAQNSADFIFVIAWEIIDS